MAEANMLDEEEVGYKFSFDPVTMVGESFWDDLVEEEEKVEQEAEDGVKIMLGGRKKFRTSYFRCENYWATTYGQLLRDPSVREEGSRAFKQFRRRYRLTAVCFEDVLMPLIRKYNVFDVTYNSRIPLEIKTMIGLRILARGSTADDMADGSGVREATCRQIFLQFIKGMSSHEVFGQIVKPPTGERLQSVMDTYSRLGFPGAVGSIDCTHIYWGKCPVSLANLCRGYEKVPSVSFEVVVDHTGHIHSCTKGFVGGINDALVVVNDPYAIQIYKGLYKDVQFSLFNAEGNLRTFKGAYLIRPFLNLSSYKITHYKMM